MVREGISRGCGDGGATRPTDGTPTSSSSVAPAAAAAPPFVSSTAVSDPCNRPFPSPFKTRGGRYTCSKDVI